MLEAAAPSVCHLPKNHGSCFTSAFQTLHILLAHYNLEPIGNSRKYGSSYAKLTNRKVARKGGKTLYIKKNLSSLQFTGSTYAKKKLRGNWPVTS